MRNPNRLADVYGKLAEIQKNTFPEMREAQYLLNLLGWIYGHKGDPFFIEGDELLQYAEEYGTSNNLLYQGWEVLDDKKETSD